MGWLALATIVAWLLVLGVGRAMLHGRAGGGPALRFADRRGSPQWWTRLLGTLGLGLLVATHQLQVRLVEEPHLRRLHGDAWRADAARTGRFVPRIGRDRPA